MPFRSSQFVAHRRETDQVAAQLCRDRGLVLVGSSVSLLCELLLAVAFHTSVCMCLCMNLHPWEEDSKGWETRPLASLGSNPETTHGAARDQELITLRFPWPHSEPGQKPDSSHNPPTSGAPRMRHPRLEGTGFFCAGHWPLVRAGTPRAGCRVGEGGRNSRGMLGMLMCETQSLMRLGPCLPPPAVGHLLLHPTYHASRPST